MTVTVGFCPIYNATTQIDNNGYPLNGGYLYTYQAGSFTVLQTTYSDNAGTIPNANPIQLTSVGRVPTEIWLDTTKSYNFVLMAADGVTILQKSDNINTTSISGPTVSVITAGAGISTSGTTGNVTISSTINEWVVGPTPTFFSTTTFTNIGNTTAYYATGRRVKAVCTAAVVYGTVISATYSGGSNLTTVVLLMDSSNILDSGLSVVSYALINSSPSSAPVQYGYPPVTLASGSSMAIGAQPTSVINVVGATTITAFDVAPAGTLRYLVFANPTTITYNSVSLILPGATNLTTTANQTVLFVSLGGGNWQYLMSGIGNIGSYLITGTIIAWAGSTAPTGYIACPTVPTNISRVTYANLFSVIGTQWGAGDGSTTFGMPFFPTGYTMLNASSGATVGVLSIGAVIAHTHTTDTYGPTYAGAVTGVVGLYPNTTGHTTGSTGGTANFAAGNSVMFCIKY
jgi:hypothetical protein